MYSLDRLIEYLEKSAKEHQEFSEEYARSGPEFMEGYYRGKKEGFELAAKWLRETKGDG